MSTSRIGGGLILCGLGFNYGCHLLGRRTICTAARQRLHLETPVGKVGALAGIVTVGVGFTFHLLNPAKLRALAELVDARAEL